MSMRGQTAWHQPQGFIQGEKIPCPHAGQTPYSRSNSTSCPPRICKRRLFFPFFSSGCSHSGHSTSRLPCSYSVCALRRAASVNIFARKTDNRRSTSSSSSRNVACGCHCRHSAIPLMISSLIPLQLWRICSSFMFFLLLFPILPPFPEFLFHPPFGHETVEKPS